MYKCHGGDHSKWSNCSDILPGNLSDLSGILWQISCNFSGILSDICSGILSVIQSGILSGMSLGPGPLDSLLSSILRSGPGVRYGVFRSRHPPQPPELAIWHSCRGTSQQKRGRRRGRRSCALLKSRDPHLAGGERTTAWRWMWDDPGHW